MSVPLYSCTCEARFVSTLAPHVLEAIPSSFQRLYIYWKRFRLRFNPSIYGRVLQPLHILEVRL